MTITGTRCLDRRFRRSPIRHASYLVEAWLLLVTWTLVMAAAVVTGVVAAPAAERDINGPRAQRHTVSAVLSENAEQPVFEGGGGDRAWATVRWTGKDGQAHQGVGRVDPGSRAGSRAQVWLDTEDRLVPDPSTAEQAEFHGAVLGTVAALLAGAAVVLTGWGARAWLERRRLAAWDKEWAGIGPQWARGTG
ncbi:MULTISPECIES: hypothetical protein [unclassified Streptomyces]|uniref:Rv1733c family protein n=1 Tax=unclassified Streptomyces TaxID=2593676 RepID=UPI0036E78C26